MRQRRHSDQFRSSAADYAEIMSWPVHSSLCDDVLVLTVCREPGDRVRNLLRRHRATGDVTPPIGDPLVGAPDDHRCPEALIADESKKCGIDYGTSFWAARPIRAMAAAAVGFE